LCNPSAGALKVFGRKQGSIERGASAAVIAFSALTFAVPCHAVPNAQAGKAFATANCSHCHSIDKFTPSSLAIAPPFRTLHKRYPVESLEEALAEGIVTGHANMPVFKLDPGQIGDFISFLKSLEP
jgi:mono/diheme cytochrome c family protein